MEQETKIILCPHCNSPVEILGDQQTVTCLGCGSRFTREELVAKGFEVTREELTAEEHRKFAGKVTTKLLIAFLFLCAVFESWGTYHGIPMASTVVVVQLVLGILALLLGYQVIPNRKPWLRISLTVVSLALVLPWVGLQIAPPSQESRGEQIQYDRLLLGNHLPPLEEDGGVVKLDNACSLWLEFNDVDQSFCDSYIRQCEACGFRLDDYQPSSGLRYYNGEGYGLTVDYTEILGTLRVQLEAPMEFAPLTWPTALLGDLLPDPGVEEAMVERMTNTQMEIYLKDMTGSRFLAYQKQLEEAGFNQGVKKENDAFYGVNANGSYVRMKEAGNGTVNLFLHLEERDRLPRLTD